MRIAIPVMSARQIRRNYQRCARCQLLITLIDRRMQAKQRSDPYQIHESARERGRATRFQNASQLHLQQRNHVVPLAWIPQTRDS
jgi:hypothetical protein